MFYVYQPECNRPDYEFEIKHKKKDVESRCARVIIKRLHKTGSSDKFMRR